MTLSPAELLIDRHQTTSFNCGVPSLDDWLKRRARANQVSGASRTYLNFEQYVRFHVRGRESVPISELEADYFTALNATVDARDKARLRRDNALIALPVIPVGLPLLWLAFVWVWAGFRHKG